MGVLPPAIAADVDWLRSRVTPFERVDGALDRPGYAPRPPGFATIVRLILEQQVSTRAAAAMWAKLSGYAGTVTPAAILALDDDTLKSCGFTRQKMAYARDIARGVGEGTVDLARLGDLTDEDALEALCALRGIGRWTAENYLLWALGRRNVFPAADLALQVGWQWLSDRPARPSAAELRDVAEAWRPRRTAAAFLLWHHYLNRTLSPLPRNDQTAR